MTWTLRRHRRDPQRGASAVEYVLGMAGVTVALMVGLEAFSASANEAYDERQALIATGVTDPSGASTSTTAGASTTVTLAPTTTTTTAPTTSTTNGGSTTTTAPTTSTTTRSYAVSATGSAAQVSNGSGHWVATVTVTVSPQPTSATVHGTYQSSDQSSPTSWSCVVSAGSCSFTTPTQNKNRDEWVTFNITSAAVNPTGTVSVPPSVRVNEP